LTYLAFLAGVVSTLSPCVLPLLPLVLGAAASEHKLGPAALATGLALSFAVIGLFVATVGFSVGLDTGAFRIAAAVLTVAIGAVLIIPGFQARFAVAGGPVANWTQRQFSGVFTGGLRGQLLVGLLLGAVWSPCAGPTLGAASILAARGEDLPKVAMIMLAFGIGAATPLLLLGVVSHEILMRSGEKVLAAGKGLKAGLGILLILIGLGIITGLDKRVEAGLVDSSPQWLTDLTTRF
jgi:cytochrome c-type biogenesis protein